MHIKQLEPGDMIYAATPIHNDGSHPHLEEDSLIADKGTRGVLVNTGHLEENPNIDIYLVRFDTGDKRLSDPVGCWAEELSAEPIENEQGEA